MAEIVFILVFAFPAILGLAEILHTVKMWIVSSGIFSKKWLVIVPDNKDFIKQILGTYEELKWQGRKLAEKIIVVDTLLNEENKKECERLALKLNLDICSKSNISESMLKEAE